MNDNRNIGVVFLMWIPYGLDVFREFLQSYLRFSAGIQHDFLIIFKDGGGSGDVEQKCRQLLSESGVAYEALTFNGGLDLDAYLYAAKNRSWEYIMFLNTKSVFLATNWLLKMHNPIQRNDIGMVSATGSWQSHRSTVFYALPWRYEKNKSFHENFIKYKMLLKAAFYYPFLFKSFPNPHLRTNAFMIRRSLFLKMRWKPLKSKFRAYLCESGRNSITNQVIRAGYRTLIVDKEGRGFEIKEWPDTRTFWINEQENLLVADNQTTLYKNADAAYKRYLTYVGWGRK